MIDCREYCFLKTRNEFYQGILVRGKLWFKNIWLSNNVRLSLVLYYRISTKQGKLSFFSVDKYDFLLKTNVSLYSPCFNILICFGIFLWHLLQQQVKKKHKIQKNKFTREQLKRIRKWFVFINCVNKCEDYQLSLLLL